MYVAKDESERKLRWKRVVAPILGCLLFCIAIVVIFCVGASTSSNRALAHDATILYEMLRSGNQKAVVAMTTPTGLRLLEQASTEHGKVQSFQLVSVHSAPLGIPTAVTFRVKRNGKFFRESVVSSGTGFSNLVTEPEATGEN